jgi:hypothetical protein
LALDFEIEQVKLKAGLGSAGIQIDLGLAPPIRQSANPPIRQSANPPIRQSANPPIRQSANLFWRMAPTGGIQPEEE